MIDGKPFVNVTVLSRENIKGWTVLDLFALLSLTQTAVCNYVYLEGIYIPAMRQQAIHMAIEKPAEYLLFIDADMRFPYNGLDRLLAANMDVVGCNYASRTQPQKNTMSDFNNDRVSSQKATVKYEEAKTLGFGFMLLRTSFLEKMVEPHCPLPYSLEARDFVGEDVTFCSRVRKAGGKVMVDHELSCEINHFASCALATF